jgi:hypothetical protein
LSYRFDSAAELARQVRNALADDAAQPLAEVQLAAPNDCNYFSELEACLGEWSFAYGVAWAMVRARDPLLSSAAVAELAREAAIEAWRSVGGESWTALLREDRLRRGPVEQDAPEPVAPQAPPAAQLDQFMGRLARTRVQRPAVRQPRGSGPKPGDSS